MVSDLLTIESEGMMVESTAVELLERAKAVYVRGSGQFRDVLLETGTLIHEFVLAHIRHADDVPEQVRLKNKWSRQDAICLACEALDVRPVYLHRLIAAAMVIQLLHDGGSPGNLPWGSIVRFQRFIIRDRKHPGRSQKCRDGVLYSHAEIWIVRVGIEEQARELFQQAVMETWSVKETYERITQVPRSGCWSDTSKMRESQQSRRSQERDQQRIDGHFERERETRTSPANLKASAAVASPGDVAEMCMDLVEAAENPRAVAMRLQGMLSKVLLRRPVTTFAG